MHWFKGKYPVYLGGGLTIVVNSLEMARDVLLDPKWPDRESDAYSAAVEAILEAAPGADPEAAFKAAAEVAGVLVQDR